jgi:phenylpropionate dioxygenase-like ring-hydroxylating dioxygenase large terminal subunit
LDAVLVAERLPNPGDRVAETVAGYPIFANPRRCRKTRAFHNVCCRRGAQLLAEGAGDCSKLVVWPYHSWSYKRDGRLNKAADFGGDANFDPDPCALHAVGAKEWRGLVFDVAPAG